MIDLFLQGEIIFWGEELVSKEDAIDKLLQVLSVDSKIIKRDEQKISDKSCEINLLTEKCNSNNKTSNVYNNLNDCIIDQSNKTKEISTQTEHQKSSIDDELLNNTFCNNVLASKHKTHKCRSKDKFGKSVKKDTSNKTSKLHEQQIPTQRAIH